MALTDLEMPRNPGTAIKVLSDGRRRMRPFVDVEADKGLRLDIQRLENDTVEVEKDRLAFKDRGHGRVTPEN